MPTLSRTNQCAKCPWKTSTDPHDIPDGYCETKHANLAGTIATPGDYSQLGQPLRVMACHHSEPGQDQHCIGWLYNQLGEGNNIALRMKMREYTNAAAIRVHGPQHKNFIDTLPKL